jgi:hypothetical protein
LSYQKRNSLDVALISNRGKILIGGTLILFGFAVFAFLWLKHMI